MNPRKAAGFRNGIERASARARVRAFVQPRERWRRSRSKIENKPSQRKKISNTNAALETFELAGYGYFVGVTTFIRGHSAGSGALCLRCDVGYSALCLRDPTKVETARPDSVGSRPRQNSGLGARSEFREL